MSDQFQYQPRSPDAFKPKAELKADKKKSPLEEWTEKMNTIEGRFCNNPRVFWDLMVTAAKIQEYFGPHSAFKGKRTDETLEALQKATLLFLRYPEVPVYGPSGSLSTESKKEIGAKLFALAVGGKPKMEAKLFEKLLARKKQTVKFTLNKDREEGTERLDTPLQQWLMNNELKILVEKGSAFSASVVNKEDEGYGKIKTLKDGTITIQPICGSNAQLKEAINDLLRKIEKLRVIAFGLGENISQVEVPTFAAFTPPTEEVKWFKIIARQKGKKASHKIKD